MVSSKCHFLPSTFFIFKSSCGDCFLVHKLYSSHVTGKLLLEIKSGYENTANRGMDTLDSEKMAKRIVHNQSITKLDANDLEKDSGKCQDHGEKRCDNDSLQVSAFPSASNLDKPYMMPLLPIPNVDRYYFNASLILTGTACKGGIGPPVGAVDIGVSKSAYYFRIALPGVKKDPGQFSCEVERDGKVIIKGVTSTGVKTVSKYSRVFEMKFQQQCPPGTFTLCFSLPGPVDPRLFSPYFRSDGILEGVVAKYE
ncbi:Hypothetical predicted protein [Olea europaea subsp. europaea]|uniref:SHSP domain-containing protein n=1 Tax=Olea europaea subsp. europaea TaxID=158383 RepID=A0A8S0T9L0_OLEEU|nr:Hypothetical predicted protein [Olea europaea subsp. europaea]